MINIVKKELEFDDELKKKIEFICGFCNTTPTIINSNMRDYTDLLHLIILNNLENTNAELVRIKIKQSDRLVQLNESARNQMKALKNNKNIKELKVLQQQVNENNKYLIENK